MTHDRDHVPQDEFLTPNSDGEFMQLTESQVARHMEAKNKRDQAMSKAAWKQNPLAMFAKHVALPYVTQGALYGTAAYGWAAYSSAPDLTKAFTVAAVAYPVAKTLEYAGRKAGFIYGHAQNLFYRDRFNEIKTEPRGRGIGIGLAAAILITGGVHINDYGRGVKDTARGIFNGASYVVDVFSTGVKTRGEQNRSAPVAPAPGN